MNLKIKFKYFNFAISSSGGGTIFCNKHGHGKGFSMTQFGVDYDNRRIYLTKGDNEHLTIHFGVAGERDEKGSLLARHLRIDMVSETVVKLQVYVKYEPVGEPVEWDFDNIYPFVNGVDTFDYSCDEECEGCSECED